MVCEGQSDQLGNAAETCIIQRVHDHTFPVNETAIGLAELHVDAAEREHEQHPL